MNVKAKYTEAKHTPGPWATDGGDTVVAMGNQVVVTAPAPDGASFDEMKANARLIAAAPDLLEALQFMHDCVTAGLTPNFDGAQWGKVVAAINKAQGA